MNATEIALMLMLGGIAGFLSGMFGIGGGLVIVPALIVLFRLEPKTAIGTSLFALLLPTGLLGVLEYARRGELRPAPGLLIALGLFCGAYLGARATGAISPTAVKRVYGAFLILVALYFFWSSGNAQSQGTVPSRVESDAKHDPQAGTSQPVHSPPDLS